ncbi:hypothetical protein K458DRAFT_427220 [Lentithecium fluviatile CBS 122367]|uniref:Rhodopsin domain-containing protein n=1 Tax=Lentithecium fluviatile CBS 122367 TaxID=1168545 RepID=A0A6G1JK09_9PLEO|nr:hypothetical protein K458DRAFT_427220 [Lentithecium fluviatile CBS 122367]
MAPGARLGQMVAGMIITYMAAFAAVVLRIVSRRLVKVTLAFDDYAAVCATGFLVMKLYDIHLGLGRHLEDIHNYTTEEVNFNILRDLWAADFFYVFACGLAKLSILALFWRLFNCSKTSKLAIQILFALSIMWFLSRLILTSIQCIPANAIWDFDITPTSCVDAALSFQATSGTHFAIDFFILLLPVVEIRKLQLPRKQRFQVAFMFMSGVLTCIACLIQVLNNYAYDFRNLDRGWTVAPIATWQSVETFLSVFTCSLPVLRPIWNLLRGRTPISRGASTGKLTTQASKTRTAGNRTWPSFSLRNQYADIESDSTYELTQTEQGKGDVRAMATPVTGISTVCVGNGGSGKEDGWKMGERDTIRAYTNIEVKVVRA